MLFQFYVRCLWINERDVVNVFFMCSKTKQNKTKEKDDAVGDGKPLRNFVNESNLSAFAFLIKNCFFSVLRLDFGYNDCWKQEII